MSYFGEFRINWRYLASATLGIAVGYGINNYLNNIFVPPLMQEFGWQSSDIALLGIAAASSFICQPVAGRLTDRFGVRRVAGFGIVCATLIYIGLGTMQGSFIQFFLLNAAQIALAAAATGPVVYSRLIAGSFDRARGMALAIAACSPSIAGVVAAPLLSGFIEREGWRAGYMAVAAITAVAGAIALLLIPAHVAAPRPASVAAQGELARLKTIAANPAFKPVVAGIFLCSLTIVMQSTQMKVILMERGLSSMDAAYVISIYALGVISGRLLCGAALDRYPAWLVAALSLGLPAAGLAILASGVTSPALLATAVVFLGAALGAEGDVGGYLAMTYFRLEVYGTVVGIVFGTLSLASALGSVILSLTLQATDSFAPFMWFAAGSALAGSGLFLLLRNVPREGRAGESHA